MLFGVAQVSPVQTGARRVALLPTNVQEENIRDAQNGDVRAFNRLVRLYQARAYRVALRVLRDADRANDATQEAFISAYRHLGSFYGGSFGAWLMRIVTNACYDQLRKNQKQHAYSLDELASDADTAESRLAAANLASPQELAERHELNEVIQQGIAALPYEQRVTLVLADVEGYTYEQVAEISQTNIGTVKSRLSRGRASLREFLLMREGLLPAKYRRKSYLDSQQPRREK